MRARKRSLGVQQQTQRMFLAYVTPSPSSPQCISGVGRVFRLTATPTSVFAGLAAAISSKQVGVLIANGNGYVWKLAALIGEEPLLL